MTQAIGKTFLAVLIVFMMSTSWGCSVLVARSGISSPAALEVPKTRGEVRDQFGEADETGTCPDGRVVERRWIRQKIKWDEPSERFEDAFKYAYLSTFGLSDIFVLPFILYRSDQAKLHYAFVYNDTGQILYRFNLKAPLPDQFTMVMSSLAKELYIQLLWGKCISWSACVTDYVKEARQRAECLGYTLGAVEEREFKDLCIISEWVDSGQGLCEEGLLDIIDVHDWESIEDSTYGL